MGKIIEVGKIKKSYQKKKILEDVSFSLESGQFITLIGHNGAGKSTLLRLISGQENRDSGEIKIFGKDPYSYGFDQRSDVFFIHEDLQMNFPTDLLGMIQIYRSVFPKFSGTLFNQMIKARKFSLKKQFSELSRGQKMQFLLMVGLAANPKLLLLDEITSVIDIDGQRYFLELLRDYVVKGGTVLITTNILSELNDYTDHLLLVQGKKLMVDSSVKKLQESFCILKRHSEHSIFSRPGVVKVRRDHDGKDLYLARKELVSSEGGLNSFVTDMPPGLEDILILHFQLEQEQLDEQVVA